MSRIKLFINNKEADLPEDFSVPMTFSFTDLENPTAVKNSYSKTVTLPGTQANNSIFDRLFDTKHVITDFNPADRIPFSLFSGSTLLESGYLTLDKVTRSNNSWTYEVTLYGGIGDFLYSLSSSTLEDLEPWFDTSITIDRNTVFTDWNSSCGISTKISWVPEYGGLTDDFSSDKVTYSLSKDPLELEDEIDQFSAGDFRSWAQRPAVYLGEILNGICSLSGYDVDIDQTWTAQDNPYWENLVVTMPMLEFGKDSSTGSVSHAFNAFYQDLAPTDASFYVDWESAQSVNLESLGPIVKPTLKTTFEMFINTTSGTSFFNADNSYFTIELCFYDKSTKGFWQTGDRIVICSKESSWTAKSHDVMFRWSDMTYADDDAGVVFHPSFYDEETGLNTHIISKTFEFDPFKTDGMSDVVPAFLVNGSYYIDLSMSNNKLEFSYGDYALRSGSTVTWKDIVKADVSQLDFLLSYLKTFGLMLVQDRQTKSVKIMPRNSFFKDYQVLDWTKKLDMSRDIEIVPVNATDRWLNFNFQEGESSYLESYLKKFGQAYGSMSFDTKLLSSDTSTDMLSDSVFTQPITTTEYIWHYKFDLVPGGTLDVRAETVYDSVPRPSNFTWDGYTRTRSDNDMCLFFRSGVSSPLYKCWISDDTEAMAFNQEFNYIYPSPELAALYTKKVVKMPVYSDYLVAGQGWPDNWSLQWSKPKKTWSGISQSDEDATLFSRFWSKYINDIYDPNTKVMTAYFKLDAEDMSQFSFKDFVFIDGQIWHVNEVTDWDPCSTDTTKVTLVQVQDIQDYVSGQRFSGTKTWYLELDKTSYQESAASSFETLLFRTNSVNGPVMLTNSNPDMLSYNSKTQTVSVTKNPEQVSRTGYMTFTITEDTSKTVRVNFFQDSAQVAYYLKPTEYSRALTSESQTLFTVNTNGTLNKQTSGYTWLYYDRISKTVNVMENSTTSTRSGTVVFALAEDSTKTLTVTVSQAGQAESYYLNTLVEQVDFDCDASTSVKVFSTNGTMTQYSGESTIVTNPDGTISVPDNHNDFSNKYSYKRWSKKVRSSVSVVLQEDSSLTAETYVTQRPEYDVRSNLDLTQSPYYYDADPDGETFDPQVKSNGTVGEGTSSVSWITVNSDGTLTVSANSSSSSRTGVVSYYCLEELSVQFSFCVTQAPASVEYSLSPETYSYIGYGDAESVLTPTTNGTLVKVSGPTWAYLDGGTLKVLSNETGNSRTGTAILSIKEDSTLTCTVTLRQASLPTD